MRVILFANTLWNIHNFRRSFVEKLLEDGIEVITLGPFDGYEKKLSAIGCTPIDIKIASTGLNPLIEAISCLRLFWIIRRLKPDLLMSYTIKPNIYSGIVGRIQNVPTITTISGLGYTFINDTRLRKFIWILYKLSQARVSAICFHNGDDSNLFLSLGIINKKQSKLVAGSGVDTDYYSYKPLRKKSETVFLMLSRLLPEKGFREFVQVAERLGNSHKNVRFQIVGQIGEGIVDKTDITRIKKNVELVGRVADVRSYLESCDCVVLPSYREGLSRSLLEACSVGRAIICTDTPGCRDLVREGENGYLCKVRDVDSLEASITKFMSLDYTKRKNMGELGRHFVENHYSNDIVCDQYTSIIQEVLRDSA